MKYFDITETIHRDMTCDNAGLNWRKYRKPDDMERYK